MKGQSQRKRTFPQRSTVLPKRKAEQTRTQRHWNTFYETWRFRQWNKN